MSEHEDKIREATRAVMTSHDATLRKLADAAPASLAGGREPERVAQIRAYVAAKAPGHEWITMRCDDVAYLLAATCAEPGAGPTMAEARAKLDDAVVALRDMAAEPERYNRAPMLQHAIDAALDTLIAAATREVAGPTREGESREPQGCPDCARGNCHRTHLVPSPQPAGAEPWLSHYPEIPRPLGEPLPASRPSPAPAVEEALREAIAFVVRGPNQAHAYHECRYCGANWWDDKEYHGRTCKVPSWRALLTQTREDTERLQP